MLKIIGIILIISGVVSLILGGVEIVSFIGGLEEPAEVSIETLDLDDEPKTVFIPEGEYEVWIEGDEIAELNVEDDEGNSVYQKEGTKSITINGRSYEKIGNLNIEEDGDYTFRSDQESTIHITEPISMITDIFKTCGLVVFGIIGLIAGLLILVLNLGKDNDSQNLSKH